jgi:hypothetical protein
LTFNYIAFGESTTLDFKAIGKQMTNLQKLLIKSHTNKGNGNILLFCSVDLTCTFKPFFFKFRSKYATVLIHLIGIVRWLLALVYIYIEYELLILSITIIAPIYYIPWMGLCEALNPFLVVPIIFQHAKQYFV